MYSEQIESMIIASLLRVRFSSEVFGFRFSWSSSRMRLRICARDFILLKGDDYIKIFSTHERPALRVESFNGSDIVSLHRIKHKKQFLMEEWKHFSFTLAHLPIFAWLFNSALLHRDYQISIFLNDDLRALEKWAHVWVGVPNFDRCFAGFHIILS